MDGEEFIIFSSFSGLWICIAIFAALSAIHRR